MKSWAHHTLISHTSHTHSHHTLTSQRPVPKTRMMKSTPTFLLLLLTILSFLYEPTSALTSHNISAVFAFGDSTVDPGNNNCFQTLFRGDHLPYGRDLPNHTASGRFSNGKIGTDHLVEMLGIKDLLPAYLDPQVTDQDLVTGVSFAAGGSGLDSKTVAITKVMDLNKEFELFQECLTKIRRLVGNENASHIIENALFVVSTGSNDLLFNAYLIPERMLSFGSIYNYHDFLLQNLLQFIQRLYGAGARRILVAGLPPLGCLPLQMTLSSLLHKNHGLGRVCNSEENTDCQSYNVKLQSHIHELQTTYRDAKIAYFDIYTVILDMVQNPAKYGFEQTLKGCCGTGFMEMGPLCNVVDQTCTDPSKYLFWDAVHLTDTGNWFITKNGIISELPYFIN